MLLVAARQINRSDSAAFAVPTHHIDFITLRALAPPIKAFSTGWSSAESLPDIEAF